MHIRVWMVIAAIVQGAIALLLFSPRGSFLFTDEYRAIVAATPWVRLSSSRHNPKH